MFKQTSAQHEAKKKLSCFMIENYDDFFPTFSFVFFCLQAVSAATSYLIVLLQFDMTSDFQKFLDNSNSTLATI